MDDLTRDAGYVFDDSAASIAIVKTASETAIGKGESVTYTYVVSNTGSTYLKDIAVTDDQIGAIGTIDLLAPGASQTLTATAVLVKDTENVGTATGTPADSDGTPIPGAKDVDDKDTATVSVNTAPAIIGDRVWNDVDGDGIQDEGEMGVYGVVVNLLAEDGTVVATTTTDANGNYRFEIENPGTYVVEFVPGSTWSFTTKDAGDDGADSDADPATGRTPAFTVSAGVTDLTLDAGLVGGVPPGICDWTEISSKFNAFIGGNFRADGGACHVRVLADADGVIEELSEGNNQLPAFAWLTPITLETAIDAEGVLLAWNCYDGQTYTILVSPLLSTIREPFTGEVEILDADGNVTAETDGLAIPADPSGMLSIRIPTTENDVSGFFSLRVNIR